VLKLELNSTRHKFGHLGSHGAISFKIKYYGFISCDPKEDMEVVWRINVWMHSIKRKGFVCVCVCVCVCLGNKSGRCRRGHREMGGEAAWMDGQRDKRMERGEKKGS